MTVFWKSKRRVVLAEGHFPLTKCITWLTVTERRLAVRANKNGLPMLLRGATVLRESFHRVLVETTNSLSLRLHIANGKHGKTRHYRAHVK